MNDIEHCTIALRDVTAVIHRSNRDVSEAAQTLKTQVRKPLMVTAALAGGAWLLWRSRPRSRKAGCAPPPSQGTTIDNRPASSQPKITALRALALSLVPVFLQQVVLPYLPERMRPLAQHPAVSVMLKRWL